MKNISWYIEICLYSIALLTVLANQDSNFDAQNKLHGIYNRIVGINKRLGLILRSKNEADKVEDIKDSKERHIKAISAFWTFGSIIIPRYEMKFIIINGLFLLKLEGVDRDIKRKTNLIVTEMNEFQNREQSTLQRFLSRRGHQDSTGGKK